MSEDHFDLRTQKQWVQDTVAKHASDLRKWVIEEHTTQRERLMEILTLWHKEALDKLHTTDEETVVFRERLISLLGRIATALEKAVPK